MIASRMSRLAARLLRRSKCMDQVRPHILPIRYDYRATTDGDIRFVFLQDGVDLRFRVAEMCFRDLQPIDGPTTLACSVASVKNGDVLCVRLSEPVASLNGIELGSELVKKSTCRKFISEISLSVNGTRLQRCCSHYLPLDNKAVASEYYFGDDYIDYPRQTATDEAVALVRRHGGHGRLVDIGCALGLYTKAFLEAGFDAYGVDISEFAIVEARKHVGTGRVQRASLDHEGIPFPDAFDVLWMWDVLEHLARPERGLANVTRQARAGALLFLHTSNADSMAHHILGKDWEGYTDYSHRGADFVSCTSLRGWLKDLGWEIIEWQCYDCWVKGPDPVLLKLAEVLSCHPEMRALVQERELGDLIRVVARRL